MGSHPADRFGRNLLRRREQAGLSREELAELTELHRVAIGLIERGERSPRLDTILKLSAGVQASPCELLAGLRWRAGYYVQGEFYVEDPSAPGNGTDDT
ncbi:MAG TPA: helix-turn-helix transcriptional regulator [Solirubrobacteraceae bacterium]|jgi:transcriptional regulator with XRE-family HTH domain|nr:helix-turn-helix transcriptional regulator [Solirubrobacteraceae bacterium]